MKTVFILIMLLGLNAQAAAYKCDPKTGKVQFHAEARPGFLKFTGTGEGPAGDVKVDKTITGKFSFKLDTLDTQNSTRNGHMKEKYLETAKYPNAELTLDEVQNFDPAKGDAKGLPFKGKLKVHGVEKPVAGTVDVAKDGEGYKVTANFPAKISDFGIAKPMHMGVGVLDDVKVAVETKLN